MLQDTVLAWKDQSCHQRLSCLVAQMVRSINKSSKVHVRTRSGILALVNIHFVDQLADPQAGRWMVVVSGAEARRCSALAFPEQKITKKKPTKNKQNNRTKEHREQQHLEDEHTCTKKENDARKCFRVPPVTVQAWLHPQPLQTCWVGDRTPAAANSIPTG
jgi:hypothetical protein